MTIILASSPGMPVSAIARLLAAGEDTVRDGVQVCNEKGPAAVAPVAREAVPA